MTTANDLLKTIKDDEVEYLDLRFTDPRGKMQHVTLHHSQVNDDLFADGAMFDGSSIAGWKDISQVRHGADARSRNRTLDPFFAQTTMAIVCDYLEPTTGEGYERDPRGTATQGGSLSANRSRRHGLFRSRGGVLHLRRRALCVRSL